MSSKCGFCGQEAPKGWKFCSPTCRNKATGKKIRDSREPVTCLRCGQQFWMPPSEIKRGRKFCSRSCADAYHREHGHPLNKVAKRVCQNCGKEFTIPQCWLKKKKNAGQYCSRGCWHEYARKNHVVFGKRVRGQGTGIYTDSSGYIHEYDPVRQKFVLQHRLVMERMLGRLLESGEKVHHRNGKRAENDPENLELLIGHHFSGKRVRDIYAKDIERLALENLKLKQQLLELKEKLKD